MNINWIRSGANFSDYNRPPEVIADLGGTAVSRYLTHLQCAGALGKSVRDAWPARSICSELEVLNLLYVPDRSLRVVGRFVGKGEEDLIVCLEVLPGEQAEKRYLDALAAGVSPDCIAHLPEWGLVALAFPADPDMPKLQGITDLVQVGELLDQPVGTYTSAEWSLLSYQPGKRCALRYRFGDRTFVGKFQRDPGDAVRSYERQLQLWSNPARRFRMPRPVACCPQLGARFETFVAASPLEIALDDACLTTLAFAVVTELAKLHTVEAPDLSRIGPENFLSRIERKMLRRLRSALPELASRGELMVSMLTERASWTLGSAPVTLHGDFHLANLLLDAQGPIFVDLDDVALGDPCYDLAMFGSRTLLRNLHRGERVGETLMMVANLPTLYVEAGGVAIQPRTFAWYMAALLLGRQVRACLRDDAPDKSRLVATLLRWSEQALRDGRFPKESAP